MMRETPQEYIKRMRTFVEGKDPLKIQQATPKKLAGLTRGLNRKAFDYRPTPDKWSITEILAHMADAELVGSWRMRLILGQNGTPIQAFDQDVWATTFAYKRRDPKMSLNVFTLLRQNNLEMLKSIPKAKWENYGMHQERGKETISRIVWMYAGHDLNHLGQIEQLAREGGKRSKARR